MASLAMLFLAIAGPWTYDVINVPAKYMCTPPNVRLEGDFCGLPISGIRMLSLLLESFSSFAMGLIFGTAVFALQAREYFLVLLFLLPYIPLLSTILSIWKKDSRRVQLVHLVVWGLAGFVVSLWSIMIIATPHPQKWRLWGCWCYLALAFAVLLIEALSLMSGQDTGTKG